MLLVEDVRACSCNSVADEVSGKNVLVEAIAHTFFDGIFLRYVVAAHWFQDEITLLFVQVFLIQKRAKFGIEVELDVPIAICFGLALTIVPVMVRQGSMTCSRSSALRKRPWYTCAQRDMSQDGPCVPCGRVVMRALT